MTNILKSIKSPQDLRKLTVTEMYKLAEEIRLLLINSISECGGHLAANLGVVELTLAIHFIFNTNRDRLIWDVGHQSYVHKILTGRCEQMSTLRQYGGLSGFPKYEESPHDAFNTGHSSTSISAALGMAIARDLQNEDYSVLAVIGDGALTGGMAFEALNHAGHEGRDLIVILNDNEMSISRNVGAMSGYLNRLRTDPSYYRTKEEIEMVLKKIPAIGVNIARAAGKVKDIVRYLMVPGILFEELGFSYVGPVNGHDLAELTRVLSNACKMKGPVLIHAITEKGRGYESARLNPDLFHGIGPFDIDTGNQKKNKTIKTYTEVFGDFMVKRASEDQKLIAITAAMTSGTGLSQFARMYPDRFFDVGICEQHAVTLAAGMAHMGLRPVVALYSSFSQRAFDQIIHDVALQNLPVILAIDRAGLVGEDGPTHHGVFDMSFLRSIPNITIMAPANENELNNMLHTACSINVPVVIRYPRGVGEGVPINSAPELLELGKSRVINDGQDLAIITVGRCLATGQEVQAILAEKGVNSALVDARFVKPLDREVIIRLSKKTNRLVTIEDNSISGGFGSAVLELLADEKIRPEVLRFGVPDRFIEHGKVDILLKSIDLDAESIADSILRTWNDLWGSNKNKIWGIIKLGQNQA